MSIQGAQDVESGERGEGRVAKRGTHVGKRLPTPTRSSTARLIIYSWNVHSQDTRVLGLGLGRPGAHNR